MNNSPPNVSTYWRPCVDGICYCDWRLTITNCYSEDIFRYINIVIIALTACVVIVGKMNRKKRMMHAVLLTPGSIGLGLLYHRLVNLKQVIFEYRNNFIRPRAMEAILFFMVFFNIRRLKESDPKSVLICHLVRLIQAIVVVSDTAQNIVFRQCKVSPCGGKANILPRLH
jgi:uncharacterized membrane protein